MANVTGVFKTKKCSCVWNGFRVTLFTDCGNGKVDLRKNRKGHFKGKNGMGESSTVSDRKSLLLSWSRGVPCSVETVPFTKCSDLLSVQKSHSEV